MPILAQLLQKLQCPYSMPNMGIILQVPSKQMRNHEMPGDRIMGTGYPLFMNTEKRTCRRHVTELVDTGTSVRRNLRNMK
jgi:hypothetical protein